MNILSFAGVAVIICLLIVVLRQQKPEYAALLTIAAGVVMAAILLDLFVPVASEISRIISGTDAAGYLSPVLKAFGVCMVTQIAADICRDAGQASIAGYVETAGRMAMALIALPLLASVLSTASGIITE